MPLQSAFGAGPFSAADAQTQLSDHRTFRLEETLEITELGSRSAGPAARSPFRALPGPAPEGERRWRRWAGAGGRRPRCCAGHRGQERHRERRRAGTGTRRNG